MAQRKQWTPEEEKFLREHRMQMSQGELARALGRTAKSVGVRMFKMGLTKDMPKETRRRWTAKEDAFLREHAQDMSSRQMATELKRSLEAVMHRLAVLQPGRECYVKEYNGKPTAYRKWTDEDLVQFRALAGTMPVEELSKRLGHSAISIMNAATRFGVSVAYERKKWTQDELNKVMIECESKTFDQLTALVPRSRAAISNKMSELGWKQLADRHSLHSAIKATGYSQSQLLRARDALGQRWKRTTKRFIISPKQLEELCEYLKWEGTERAA